MFAFIQHSLNHALSFSSSTVIHPPILKENNQNEWGRYAKYLIGQNNLNKLQEIIEDEDNYHFNQHNMLENLYQYAKEANKAKIADYLSSVLIKANTNSALSCVDSDTILFQKLLNHFQVDFSVLLAYVLDKNNKMAENFLRNHPSFLSRANLYTSIALTETKEPHSVATLLAMKADINHLNEDQSALHKAASSGRLDMMNVLLEFKADAHIKDSKGNTPLTLALQKNHFFCVEPLILKMQIEEDDLKKIIFSIRPRYKTRVVELLFYLLRLHAHATPSAKKYLMDFFNEMNQQTLRIPKVNSPQPQDDTQYQLLSSTRSAILTKEMSRTFANLIKNDNVQALQVFANEHQLSLANAILQIDYSSGIAHSVRTFHSEFFHYTCLAFAVKQDSLAVAVYLLKELHAPVNATHTHLVTSNNHTAISFICSAEMANLLLEHKATIDDIPENLYWPSPLSAALNSGSSTVVSPILDALFETGRTIDFKSYSISDRALISNSMWSKNARLKTQITETTRLNDDCVDIVADYLTEKTKLHFTR